MKKTGQLRALLDQYHQILNEEEFSSFEKEVLRLLSHYSALLAKYPAGASRGRKVQALIDEQVELSAHIKTTCQKGCGACCHLEVEITRDDAEILADSIASGIGVSSDDLLQLAQRQRLDSEWTKGAVPSNRCVFLGPDNACRNYENRPSVCRKHSVVSPVIECEKPGGTPIPKVMPLAEIILSAAINQNHNDFAALPKMLQRVLDERQNGGHLPLEPSHHAEN